MQVKKLLLENNKIESLKVLSFGCGCGLDFYGLYFARKICDMVQFPVFYRGIDLVEWEYRDLIKIQRNLHAQFFYRDIAGIPSDSLKKCNVFVFPKSLSEFPPEAFRSLLGNIQQSNFASPLILAASMVSSQDDKGFRSLISALGREDDSLGQLYSATTQDAPICSDWRFWKYPDEVMANLKKIENFCSDYIACSQIQDCEKNHRAKTPILRQNYVRCYVETFPEL